MCCAEILKKATGGPGSFVALEYFLLVSTMKITSGDTTAENALAQLSGLCSWPCCKFPV